jgi:hypothetical protein
LQALSGPGVLADNKGDEALSRPEVGRKARVGTASAVTMAKAIAFAIASRQKREGMPTKASARLSKSGKRTGFIEIALDDIEPKLAALIEQGVEESINFVLESFFKTQINR